MGTKFEEIYKLFLSSIDDYELGSVSEEELGEILKGYLLNGVIQLQTSMIDVSDFNEEEETFNKNLDHMDKILLGKSMKLEWIGEKLNNADLMRKNIGDRDYKSVQGTDYLKQLNILQFRLRQEIDRLAIDLSYANEDEMGGLW